MPRGAFSELLRKRQDKLNRRVFRHILFGQEHRAGRVVFNIKGNDYRSMAALQYRAGVLAIRFFGSHAEYDKIDAETV